MSAPGAARGPKIERGKPLTKKDYESLEKRWINRELADGAHLRRVDDQEGGVILGRNGRGHWAGILIPYIFAGALYPHEYRIRRDHPEMKKGKPQGKYMAPSGSRNRLYFVPGTDPTWIADTTMPIIITEGELKSLALWRLAHQLGDAAERPRFLPLGIAGVWNWQGTIGKTEDATGARVDDKGPIPDLGLLKWESRKVTILFDADMDQKRDVRIARTLLTRHLEGRGAEVKWFSWPENLPDGVKGIDDYLAARGPESALELIRTAVAPRKAEQNATPFQVSEKGVYYVDRDGTSTRICAELKILGHVRSHDGSDWGVYLEWRDDDHVLHRWAMPAELLAGDENEYRKHLLREGLRLAHGKRTREHLSNYIQSNHCDVRFWCAKNVGWHGRQFVLPDGAISEPGQDGVVFQPGHDGTHYYTAAGTLVDWTENVGKLCRKNSRLILAVSAAFAGPLLRLLEAESGGFHFVGLTSLGKTTALIVAGSVLGGGGERGFINSWLSTSNALEWTAESHNDLALMLDEINLIDPMKAIEAAYMLTSNVGKGRANKSGGTRATPKWQLIILSSGEQSLEEHAATAGRIAQGGARLRLANIPADAGSGNGLFEDIHSATNPRDFAVLLRRNALRYYGTPIRAFLKELVDKRIVVQDRIQRDYEAFIRNNNRERSMSEEAGRVLARFAAVAVAGELATEWGITGWQVGDANKAAMDCFEAWRARQPGNGASDDEMAIKHVRAALLAHSNSRFQSTQRLDRSGETIPERIINQLGFREEIAGETTHFVFADAFRDELCKGFDYQRVARLLAERGYLDHGDGNNLAKKKRLPRLGSVRVYTILPSLLDS